MQLYEDVSADVPKYRARRYEEAAAKFWDGFYKKNQRNFFKDRHYLDREFPILLSPNITVLEVGCGVGNTSLPLSDLNASARIYSCDYATTAVQLLASDANFKRERMHAFVADITKDSLLVHIPAGTVDVVTCIFVLSANSLQTLPEAVRNVRSVLKPGYGTVVVRDYAAGDLAEERLASDGRQQKLDDNFYVRGDGTRCLYFSKGSLCKLFEDEGFVCKDVHIHERIIENRKRQLSMRRRWIQAVFCLPPGPPDDLLIPTGLEDVTFKATRRAQEHIDMHNGVPVPAAAAENAMAASEQACSAVGDGAHGTVALDRLRQVARTVLQSVAHAHSTPDGVERPAMDAIKLLGSTLPASCQRLISPHAPPSAVELCLAQWFVEHAGMLQGRTCADFGSGGSCLPGLVAVQHCRRYSYAVDDDTQCRVLRQRLRWHSSFVISERLRLESLDALLCTGNACTRLEGSYARPCFDVVVVNLVDGLSLWESCAVGLHNVIEGGLLLVVGHRVEENADLSSCETRTWGMDLVDKAGSLVAFQTTKKQLAVRV